MFVVGGVTLGLLLLGIRNAWDTVTHIVVRTRNNAGYVGRNSSCANDGRAGLNREVRPTTAPATTDPTRTVDGRRAQL